MEDKIRKAIREQIKNLHEARQALQVTMENGVVAIIEDPKDIEAYDRGLTVWGTDADGKEHELNIDWSLDSHMTANEGMSPEEWADAKEAERLAKHPEREKIMKIKQMMDKEKGITGMEDSEDDKKDWTPEDHEEEEKWQRGWKYESLKETATELGYLNEEFHHSKFDFQEKVIKASFVYTEQGGHFYSLTLYSSEGQKLKMKYDEANEWVKEQLEYIHEGDLLPRRYNSGLEDLDLIVARLEELGIEASHGDYMDVS